MSIESFGQALAPLSLSFATFTISGKTYTKIWNTWFAARSFVYSPSVVAAWLIFPNFWSSLPSGQVTFRLNGGNRNRVSQMAMWFLDRPNLRALQAWEDAFLSVETELSREALKQAYHQSIRHMKNADELKNFYDGGTVIKISDKVLSDLTDEQRTFFRVYYEELLERSTQKYMADIGVTRAILTNSARCSRWIGCSDDHARTGSSSGRIRLLKMFTISLRLRLPSVGPLITLDVSWLMVWCRFWMHRITPGEAYSDCGQAVRQARLWHAVRL
ncbi:MAG: hypothetical protein IPJ71_19210 [Bdellovibrionales bacterium]|nr:hypothetical protein [Bdellovibrionales bacterium]